MATILTDVSLSPDIEKPLLDERDSAYFKLPNGIAAVVISDKRSEKSSAALSVAAGAALDTLPGLAHMTEHAVFLGSEKYPVENAYKQYLSKNGGSSNGGTGMEYTVYKFNVNANAFDGALDIFAQFFVKPLFLEEAMAREVHAVDSEDSKNRNLDNRRLLQVMKHVMDPSLPYAKYSTGNLRTLAFGQVEEHAGLLSSAIRNFHEHFYTPHDMFVCLVGPQTIPELTSLVHAHFAAIKAASSKSIVDIASFEDHRQPHVTFNDKPIFQIPTREESVDKSGIPMIEVRPVKDIRDLSLLWQLPYHKDRHAEDPTALIGFILNQPHEFSLLSTLQDEGLVTSISGSTRSTFRDTMLFEVHASLTSDGLAQWPRIIYAIKQTLLLLQQAADEELTRLWFELHSLCALSFAFKASRSAYEEAEHVASSLLDHPPNEVLSAGSLMSPTPDLPWLRATINTLLTPLLTPTDSTGKCLIVRRSSTFTHLPEDDGEYLTRAMQTFSQQEKAPNEKDGSYFTRLKEHLLQPSEAVTEAQEEKKVMWELFYGVPFTLSQVPLTQLHPASSSAMTVKLPDANRFLATELLQSVREQPDMFRQRLAGRKLRSTHPTPLDSQQSSLMTVWHSQDEAMMVPKAIVKVFLPRQASDVPPTIDPLNGLLATLFDQLLLRRYSDAFTAGLTADMSFSRRGLSLSFSGYTATLMNFAETVIKDILNLSTWRTFVTPQLFENYRERQLRSLRSYKKNRPDSLAEMFASYLLDEGGLLPEEKIARLENVQYEELFDRIQTLQSVLQGPAQEADEGGRLVYMHGDVLREHAKEKLVPLLSTLGHSREAESQGRTDIKSKSNINTSDHGRLLPRGQHSILAMPALNPAEPNHAFYLIIQAEVMTPKIIAQLMLLRRLWSEPAFNTLRTQQQLGYIVSLSTTAFGNGRNSIRAIELRILSKRATPRQMQQQVALFLQDQVAALQSGATGSDDDIKRLAEVLIKSLQDPPTSYQEEASEFWGLIKQDFPFDWQERVIYELRAVSLAELQEAAQIWVGDAQNRRSMSVLVYGAEEDGEEKRGVWQADVAAMKQDGEGFMGASVQVFDGIESAVKWSRDLPWAEPSSTDL